MKYTLFLYSDETTMAAATPEQGAQMLSAYRAYTQALRDAQVFVATDWLQPTVTATMLTIEDGRVRTVDGPYAETKEQLGGYYVIDVPDLDAAITWAARCPVAQVGGKIELRPSHGV